MASAYDLSGLVAHINENGTDFALPALTGSKIFSLGCDVMEGFKQGQTTKINLLTTAVPFYAASACAVNATGAVTPTTVSITTSSIATSPEFCEYDLEPYMIGSANLKKGSNYDAPSAFWGKISNDLSRRMALGIGMMLVQGKTTYTNDTHLKQLNGFIASLDTLGTAVNGNTSSATSITASNVITLVDNMLAAAPNRVFTGVNTQLWMGYNDYRLLTQALRNANAFNYYTTAADYKGDGGLVFPGTNVKIVPVPELNNDNPVETGALPTAVKNRMFLLDPSNFIIATDKKGDFDTFDVWFDKNTRKVKTFCRFTYGVAFKYANEIVQYTNV